MEDLIIFYVGLFCFVLAIVGAVMTHLEFKNIELKAKKYFVLAIVGAVMTHLEFKNIELKAKK